MVIIDLKSQPLGAATYIGRRTPQMKRSVLANPFKLRDAPTSIDGIPITNSPAALLERYRRHVTYNLAHGYQADVDAFRALNRRSALACWCVARDATIQHGPIRHVGDGCHGDVVYTIWEGLNQLGWRWQTGSRMHDFSRFGPIHEQLYLALFHCTMAEAAEGQKAEDINRKGKRDRKT